MPINNEKNSDFKNNDSITQLLSALINRRRIVQIKGIIGISINGFLIPIFALAIGMSLKDDPREPGIIIFLLLILLFQLYRFSVGIRRISLLRVYMDYFHLFQISDEYRVAEFACALNCSEKKVIRTLKQLEKEKLLPSLIVLNGVIDIREFNYNQKIRTKKFEWISTKCPHCGANFKIKKCPNAKCPYCDNPIFPD